MISRIAIHLLKPRSMAYIPYGRFSEKPVEEVRIQVEESPQERILEAEVANPKLESKEQAFSYFRLGWRVFWWSMTGLFCYNLYLNNSSDKPSDQLGYIQPINNAAKYCQQQYQDLYDFITKPPIDKLLPDLPNLPPGYEIPKTLVLNLSGTLVHMDYVFGKGAEIKKRQGLQKLLSQLSRKFELVILSDDDTMFTQTVCEKIDPSHQYLSGRFGRESHVLEKNKYIKDLKYLNRPISKIVVIETNPDRMINYQDNAIFIKQYDGQENDTVLVDLLPFLEHLAKGDIRDVRSELKKYGNFDPQVKYKEELKVREIQMSENMKKGVMGLFGSMAQQKKNPNFSDNKRI